MSKIEKLHTGPAKGMRDFLPLQTELRDFLTDKILACYRSFGFERIETPICEDIRRLRGSEGGENLQLIFEILKRGEKLKLDADTRVADLVEMGLRFDLTVPLVRYYCEHRAHLPQPFKAVQVGSVFRAERPQKGRYRQFTQCDIDVLGGQAPQTEIELLLASTQALSSIGFKNLVVKLNDRRLLSALVQEAGFDAQSQASVLISLDKFDKIGLSGVQKELLARNFSAQAVDWIIRALSQQKPSLESFEEILPSLDPIIFEHLRITLTALKELLPAESRIEFDPFLVRGMGYYTGQIFEIQMPDAGIGSLGGGGRYDQMVGKMSGQDTAACGFSIGFERVFYLLEQQGLKSQNQHTHKIALFYDHQHDYLAALKQADQLRLQGNVVLVAEAPKKMKGKLQQLKDSGYHEFAFVKPDQELELKQLS